MHSLEKFKAVTTLIFDVDGVLTDSKVTVLENGHMIRTMSVRDGYALKRAVEKGFKVIIITGGNSTGVAQRLKNLGIAAVFSGISDKLKIYRDLRATIGFSDEEVLYMGDDMPDYEVMRRVGLPCCPSDAVPEIKEVAIYTSPVKGGDGCARDVLEKVLKLNGKW